MSKKLNDVIDNIEKRLGKGTIRAMDQYIDIERSSSGSIGLDVALGGGYGKGRIVEIYGAESSGKTTTALHSAVEVQKAGKIVLYLDYENAIDPYYCECIGLDLSADKFRLVNPETTEDGFEIIRSFLEVDDIGLIVVDSVAAMVPRAELIGEFGDSKMGLQARAMSQGLRMLTNSIGKSKCIVIFINQTRDKIGVMFGDPTTTTGGNALKFYATQRLKVTKAGGDKDDSGEYTSILSKINIIKNKIAPPMRKCEVPISFGVGFDKISELVTLGADTGVITKKGSWYSYEEAKLGQGSDAVKAIMEDNPEMTAEIEHKVRLNLGLIQE